MNISFQALRDSLICQKIVYSPGKFDMEGTAGNSDLSYKISFAMIRLFHDNVLLRSYIDPAKLLHDLGLSEGDVVLEVGCGPGFYTIGAALATGPGGQVYSYDINPYAIRYARRKIRDAGLKNVKLENRSAANTGLPDESVNFAFIVGVPHVVGSIDSLTDEIARVIKPKGLLAISSNRNNTVQFMNRMQLRELCLEYKLGRFSVFEKIK